MKNILLAFIMALTAMTAGCSLETKNELETVVENSLKALEDEDYYAFMKTVVVADDLEESSLRALLLAAFDLGDISHKLLQFKMISCDGDRAEAEIVREIRVIRGRFSTRGSILMQRVPFIKTADGWKIDFYRIRNLREADL